MCNDKEDSAANFGPELLHLSPQNKWGISNQLLRTIA